MPAIPSLNPVMVVTEESGRSHVQEVHGVRASLEGNIPNLARAGLWHALDRLKSSRQYEEHEWLFRDGEPCAGIYLVEAGEINLLLPAREKQYRIFETAGAGSVLGLPEAMGGSPHRLSAEVAGPVRVAYIERMALMNYLSAHCEACMQVVALLSEDLHGLYRRCRTLTPLGAKRGRKSVIH